jgi:phosphatidylglycerophosphate synthase
VILERLSYSVVTLALVGIWAGVALAAVPLSMYWRDVFFWVAFAAAILIFLIVLAIRGEGTYMSRFLESLARATRGALGTHAVGRFLVRAEQQLLEFARADRRRVVRVIAGDALNYVLMAAEVWVVLRAVGVASGFANALTIETFTRVISVAAAPIPAGLGALEASHLAAASAVGVASAGAALAIARRVRGLFWAGVGFAVYPRRVHREGIGDQGSGIGDQGSGIGDQGPGIGGSGFSPRDSDRKVLLYVVDDPSVMVSPATRLGGLPISERVLRPAARDGYSRVIAWAPRSGAAVRTIADRLGRESPPLTIATTDTEWGQALASESRSTHVAIEPGTILRPSLRVQCLDDLPIAERTLRQSIFKPTDGVVARFNRRISLPISLVLIRTPITANQISIALVGLGLWAAWLFSLGTYGAGVLGAAISLAASLLDGCDGEVARLKYQESAFGCWLETIGDYTYYIAIFGGLTIGAVRATHNPLFYTLGFAALAGSLITASILILLRRRLTADRPERFGAVGKAHFMSGGETWVRLLARLSVCATRAVMPYGILILAIAGLAPAVVVLAAIGANVYWLALAPRFRMWLSPTGAAVIEAGEP